MKTELDTLEGKLAQLVQFARRLRAENYRLRQQLAEAQSQNRISNDKIGSAKLRLEGLLAQLPKEEA
jgi:regulator of replication initiation timing